MGITFSKVKIKGWEALVKELGYAGATKFLLLYSRGEGDYTKKRRKLFKDLTVEEIVEDMKKVRRKR